MIPEVRLQIIRGFQGKDPSGFHSTTAINFAVFTCLYPAYFGKN